MSKGLIRHNQPLRDQLHPVIYRVAGGLVVWFVLSAWLLFDRQHRTAGAARLASSLRDWAFGDFEVWQARLHGAHAAIDMLLPLAAVAFGLTAIGIVFIVVAQTVH